jgi:hypothetical protein
MFRQVVQIFQEQQSDEGCPNLNTKSVLACTEIKVIYQEDYLSQLYFIPNNNTSKQMGPVILGFYSGESNKLVSKD